MGVDQCESRGLVPIHVWFSGQLQAPLGWPSEPLSTVTQILIKSYPRVNVQRKGTKVVAGAFCLQGKWVG